MSFIKRSLILCTAFGLAFAADHTSAQTLTLISPTVNDGGFEDILGAKSFFQSPNMGAGSNIPYWGATLVNTAGAAVAAPDNSGAEAANPAGPGAADVSATHSGAAGAFWQPGGNSTAFNLVTSNPITANTTYTLTWYARLTGAGGAQAVSLFSQLTSTTASGSYAYQPSGTLIAVDGTTNTTYVLNPTHDFTQYTLTYTAKAADAGKYIGLTFGNSGTAYIAADDFTLTATVVPEPSTYALVSVGLVGLLLLWRRSEHALV